MRKGSKTGKPSWNKGLSPSEETRKKISASLKGNCLSPESRKKISDAMKGRDIRKGNHHVSEETREKLRIANTGKKRSAESRIRMSIAMIGKNMGKSRPCSENTKIKISKALTGKKRPEASKKRDSLIRTAQWKNPDYVHKQRRARQISPNKPEIKLLGILNALFPGDWKFTGDFSFTINGKCPDFVNCNGQKKIIELFGDYWHREDDPEERKKAFAPFGYETLIIWESELKKPETVERIKKFGITTYKTP
jgi:very-short-patch-repair endonuclease